VQLIGSFSSIVAIVLTLFLIPKGKQTEELEHQKSGSRMTEDSVMERCLGSKAASSEVSLEEIPKSVSV